MNSLSDQVSNAQKLRRFSGGKLSLFLPSNNEEESWPAVEAYSFDEFRMYEFKVRRCTRGRAHDWTECPFAHPGEKARRRDPRKFHYSGTGCPDLRKGSCRRGDSCEFAHGVFECWLHPARYRTQPCKEGRSCRRRVCFFAHTPEQLRVMPGGGSSSHFNFTHKVIDSGSGCSYDGSPFRFSMNVASFKGGFYDFLSSPPFLYRKKVDEVKISSPTSTLVGISPPISPSGSPTLSPEGSRTWAYPHKAGSVTVPFNRTGNINNGGKNGSGYEDVELIINSLQQMVVNGETQNQHYECKSCMSPIAIFDKTGEGFSSSESVAINAAWNNQFNWGENGSQQVESVQDGKNNSNVTEYPDLSWVNELVM